MRSPRRAEKGVCRRRAPGDQGDRLYDADGHLLFDHDGSGHNRPEIDRTALRKILINALAPGTIRLEPPHCRT
jgi:hypothetical protein